MSRIQYGGLFPKSKVDKTLVVAINLNCGRRVKFCNYSKTKFAKFHTMLQKGH